MTARTINVRLPKALYKQIEELATATARTKSFLAVDALTQYVQNESWQIRDIHEGIKEADAGEFATEKQVKAVFAKYGDRFVLIKWTKTALASVDDIAGFIAKDNPTRATSFALELQSAVTQLQAHPGMGRAGRVPGTRELVLHKNYIAIYRVRGNVVEILRLHHAARKL